MSTLYHPERIVALAFLFAIGVGTALLMLPVAQAEGQAAPWLTALFTAVSAVCVTGLAVVDTGTYWSGFGQWVLVGLFQVGGFGMMTAATLLGTMVNRSLQLRMRLVTQVESHVIGLGDVTSVAKLVFIVTVAMELLTAAALATRLHLGYGLPWNDAAWSGLFHSISAFNNAGFSIHGDSLMRYATDVWMLAPVMAAIVIGGLGFPVLHDLRVRWHDPRHWTLHTKLTLMGTAMLLAGGFVVLMWFEWSNAKTLGALAWPDKMLAAAFSSVSARTAGFNVIDIGALTHESLALHYLLMFVGGGSAGTAGGVKVGTFLVLLLLVWSEVRGRSDTQAFGRRISQAAQRQAITVLMLGGMVVVAGTLVLLHSSPLPVNQIIFEVVSAFATVGLSTGITAELPPIGQLTLIVLMYAGRVGTITLATSLATGARRTAFR